MQKFQAGPLQKIRDCEIGSGVFIDDFVNLYECKIGADTRIGAFVEIGRGVTIGQRCVISNHAYICPGVTLEDDVFVGESVLFCNDKYARACNDEGVLLKDGDWTLLPTLVKSAASIAARSVILCDLTIGLAARIEAGAVVTRDVPDGARVGGNPAQIVGESQDDEKLSGLE